MTVQPIGTFHNSTGLQGLFKDVGGGIVRAASSHQKAISQKAVHVPLWPMLPVLLTGGAILYNQGILSNNTHGNADPGAWKRVLLESALGQWLAQNTTGVFPLMWLGLSAFRAGQENTLPNKVHAIINTSATLGLGWLGVNLFAGMSEAAREIDDQVILHHLNQKELASWLQDTLASHSDPKHQALSNTLAQLRETLEQKAKTAKLEWEERQVLKQSAGKIKSSLVRQLDELGHALNRPTPLPLKAQFNQLNAWIRHSDSGFTKFLRAVNPMCGYILTGLLLAGPVARWVNNTVDKYVLNRYPALKTRSFNTPDINQGSGILQRGFLSAGKSTGFHGSYGHAIPAASLDGPTLQWVDTVGQNMR